MVVNGEKIFFFEYHPFEKRGGVNLEGGAFFEKSLARSLFRYAHAPSSDTRPCPAWGGVGQPENRGTEYLYHYMRQPSNWSKPNPISLNKD